MKKIIALIKTIIVHTIYHKNIKKNKGFIKIDGKYKLNLSKSSKIILDSKLTLGKNSLGNNSQTTIRMDKNSILKVNGNFSFYYGDDIILFEGATLSVGSSFINSGAKIRCHKSITIGDGCAISHDFKDHVWIGTRVTILS